ncbi:MAG: DUF2207 domain-containing protein [Candidatus Melainabacteria bacterium]|nr:DUF2207 domain-containing protein [Candidatus Melainabacteria bacterium]
MLRSPLTVVGQQGAVAQCLLWLVSVLVAMLAWVLPCHAEVIRSFDVDVRLNRDCSLDVTENIHMDFEGAQRHGIYRIIPYSYTRWGGNYTTELRLMSIVDENESPYRYDKEIQGRDVNIRIGDPNVIVSGEQTYCLRYHVRRAVNFFGGAPEVYWNATGNEWPFSIEKVSVNFYPPTGMSTNEIQTACYVGPLGSRKTGQIKQERSRIVFSAYGLHPAEGMTIVAALPKGSVERPSLSQELAWFFKDWWPLLCVPGITAFVLWSEWASSGRDEDGGKPVAVEWNPPKELTPAEVGTLVDERCDTTDIVATLIDLAARGFLKIKDRPCSNGFLFFSIQDYEFTRTYNEPDTKGLRLHEVMFLDGLFKGYKNTVLLSDLKYKFYEYLPKMRNEIYQSLTERRFFKQNPDVVRFVHYFVAFLFLALGVFLAITSDLTQQMPLAAGIILSALVVFISARAMPARTRSGSRTLRECLGFQRFVRLAEKDRIAVLAKDDPTIFGRLLPYAMVLGVGDEWAVAFQDLLSQPPDWYEPYNLHSPDYVFRPRLFVGDLGHGMQTMGETFSSKEPSSSASGAGGGFSGLDGGFSGGGFGGGGGGSW